MGESTARLTKDGIGPLIERMGQSILIGSDDAREAMQAFRDKRPPSFKGR